MKRCKQRDGINELQYIVSMLKQDPDVDFHDLESLTEIIEGELEENYPDVYVSHRDIRNFLIISSRKEQKV